MRLRTKAFYSLIIGLIALWGVLPGLHGAAQANDSAKISAPANGSSLFGVVTISGTASSPTLQAYRLEYLSLAGANAQWQAIGKPVSQQVVNSVLGQWDTRGLPDGAYQLRLRVTLRDGTVLEDYVRDVKVNNQQPTPLPTIPPPPTATLLPTAGPSPSPLIQQPPTTTPRVAAVVVSTPAAPGSAVSLIGNGIWSAVCGGTLIALIGFVLFGIARMARERIRQMPVNRNG